MRHRVPVIAVVGNDAKWAQIARDQVAVLGDDVATQLARTDYHRVVEGFGAKGLLLDDPARTADTLAEARRVASQGVPVLVNALIGDTEFGRGRSRFRATDDCAPPGAPPQSSPEFVNVTVAIDE